MSIEIKQTIDNFSTLGKPVKLSPKSKVALNKSGFTAQYDCETVSVNIGIGKDHTALLVMPKAAWDDLNKGEEVTAITLKSFKQNMHLPKK